MRNFHLIWALSLILEAAFSLNTRSEIMRTFRLKKAYLLPARSRKEDLVEKVANRHLLKQPLMKFDLLWKKFNGRKRSDYDVLLL
ncbi:hypothetical protein Q1695_001150 [Nippostrongylus brasiliensis]|nr:hypothetical protein Q1695_001150 [Nippostrongylus brasiliensis]